MRSASLSFLVMGRTTTSTGLPRWLWQPTKASWSSTLGCSVLHFDSKGRFVSKWGRNGSGPGEMRHPNLLGWYRDTLWVFDESLARITLFRQSGIPVRSIRLPVSGRGYLLNSGSVVALPSLIYGAGRRKGPPLLISDGILSKEFSLTLFSQFRRFMGF